MPGQIEASCDKPNLDTCLVGMLETWPLADLLVWLHQSKRTAMVRVGHDLDAGVIFFRDGRLLRCEWKERCGEDALLGLLALANGSFALIQRAVPEVRANIQKPTPELLLQCTMGLDQRRRIQEA